MKASLAQLAVLDEALDGARQGAGEDEGVEDDDAVPAAEGDALHGGQPRRGRAGEGGEGGRAALKQPGWGVGVSAQWVPFFERFEIFQILVPKNFDA